MRSDYRRRLTGTAFDPALVGDKLVLIAGPRQCGKTTLARAWLVRHRSASHYFNWDDPAVRRAYREDPHFFEPQVRATRVRQPWIAVDEIHKATRWRDILKGWYDTFHQEFRFVVTGSARLDLLRRGGDSLVGRYLLFHLFPISFNELCGVGGSPPPPAWVGSRAPAEVDWALPAGSSGALDLLLRRGPFPEPLQRDSDRFQRRWSADYLSLLIRGDLRDLTRLAQLDRLETLVDVLPGSVGSPVSYSSLGRDLEVAHSTIRLWLEALRRLYLVFPVRPYAHKVRRALRREPKWYFLDWSHVAAEAPRFENLVASSLAQACQTWTDAGHGRYELRTFRTLDGAEIDFVVLADGRPRAAIEVKSGDLVPSPALLRATQYLGPGITSIQVVRRPDVARRVAPDVWVVSVDRFLAQLH